MTGQFLQEVSIVCLMVNDGRRRYLNPSSIPLLGPVDWHGMNAVIEALRKKKECCEKKGYFK